MTFNRHADLSGTPNGGGQPCSLASSGGVYAEAWAWLYHKTGERRFLHRMHGICRLYLGVTCLKTGLFNSSEDRPTELWYADVLDYALALLRAATWLGAEATEIRREAIALFHAYDRHAFVAEGLGYFDTLDITTGQPVIGPSRHYPTIHRPRHLEAWVARDNSVKLVALAVTSGAAYALTGDDRLRVMFDRAIGLLEIPRRTREATPLIAGDAAGVILALLHVARRGGDRGEHALAAALVEHVLAHNYRNDVITTGINDDRHYYASRAGCGDLAAALLAFAIAASRRDDPLPPIRQPLGVMPW